MLLAETSFYVPEVKKPAKCGFAGLGFWCCLNPGDKLLCSVCPLFCKSNECFHGFKCSVMITLIAHLSSEIFIVISLQMSLFNAAFKERLFSSNGSHLFVQRWSFYGFLLTLFAPLESVRWNKSQKWLKPGSLRQTDRQREWERRGEEAGGETAVFVCCLVLIW